MQSTPTCLIRALALGLFCSALASPSYGQPARKNARHWIESAYRKADVAIATHDIDGCLAIVPWSQIGSPGAQQQMRIKLRQQLKLMFASELVLHQVTTIQQFKLTGNRATVRVHRHTTASNSARVPIPVSNPDRSSQDEWLLTSSGWKPLRSVLFADTKTAKLPVQPKSGP